MRLHLVCAAPTVHSRSLTHWALWLPGAVYICTEDAFPSKRLWQLIEQQQKLRTDVPGELIEKIRFSNHIFIEHAADVVSVCLCARMAQ